MFEPPVRAHWHQSVAELSIVPSEFYAAIEAAVTALNIPQVYLTRTSYYEGAVFSGLREYLRVRRGEFYFDICGAPFANGSFVSWWLVEDEGCARGCLSMIPILGLLLNLLVFRETYYKVDSRQMFQDAVHSAVLGVLDNLMTVKGLRTLAGTERQPTMRDALK